MAKCLLGDRTPLCRCCCFNSMFMFRCFFLHFHWIDCTKHISGGKSYITQMKRIIYFFLTPPSDLAWYLPFVTIGSMGGCQPLGAKATKLSFAFPAGDVSSATCQILRPFPHAEDIDRPLSGGGKSILFHQFITHDLSFTCLPHLCNV